jgi:hypothetical protein
MDPRLTELYETRARLRGRIGAQREQLARDLAPLAQALHTVDRAQGQYRKARDWLRAHPGLVTAAVAALAVWRPRGALRSMRWGLTAWRQWRRVQAWAGTGAKAP